VLGVTQDTYSGLGQIHEAYCQSTTKNCLRLAAVLTFHGAIQTIPMQHAHPHLHMGSIKLML